MNGKHVAKHAAPAAAKAGRQTTPDAPARVSHAAPPVDPPHHLVARTIVCLIATLLAIAAAALVGTERWAMTTWSELSPDEILYHLSVSLQGTNASMISDYLLHYGIFELAAVVLAIGVLLALRRRRRAFHIALATVIVLSLGAIAWAWHDFDTRTHAGSYIASVISGGSSAAAGADGQAQGDFIAERYVDPAAAQIGFPKQKRNLIYLYLESMETTFSDTAHGGAFERDVIPELTALAAEGQSFNGRTDLVNGGISLPGSTWTMGAMFAQTSGLPLKLAVGGNQMTEQEQFFPGIVTLGDILARQGYTQELLIGSEAAFAGRDLYFRQHGGYEMRDYTWARESGFIDPDYQVFWGFEDEKLYDLARDEAARLAALDEPFNLTLLTVDTHFEDGYVCRLCNDEFGDNQYANVFACASRQAADFVEWVQQQPWGEDTTIVICGDHPTMDVDFCADVPANYQRRTYTTILNGAATPADSGKWRTFTTFDLFPTTLAALGCTIPTDRLGLGVNLYASEPTLVEELGVAEATRLLEAPSKFLSDYSGVVIDDATMARAAANNWLEYAVGDDRRLTFKLVMGYVLNFDVVSGMNLTIADDRTGAERTYPLEVFASESNPNFFAGTVTCDFTPEDLEHLSVSATIDVEGHEGYPVMEGVTQEQMIDGASSGRPVLEASGRTDLI